MIPNEARFTFNTVLHIHAEEKSSKFNVFFKV